MLHPENPLLVPTVPMPHSTGLQDPFFIIPVLAEHEPPRQLFLSYLMLEGS